MYGALQFYFGMSLVVWQVEGATHGQPCPEQFRPVVRRIQVYSQNQPSTVVDLGDPDTSHLLRTCELGGDCSLLWTMQSTKYESRCKNNSCFVDATIGCISYNSNLTIGRRSLCGELRLCPGNSLVRIMEDTSYNGNCNGEQTCRNKQCLVTNDKYVTYQCFPGEELYHSIGGCEEEDFDKTWCGEGSFISVQGVLLGSRFDPSIKSSCPERTESCFEFTGDPGLADVKRSCDHREDCRNLTLGQEHIKMCDTRKIYYRKVFFTCSPKSPNKVVIIVVPIVLVLLLAVCIGLTLKYRHKIPKVSCKNCEFFIEMPTPFPPQPVPKDCVSGTTGANVGGSADNSKPSPTKEVDSEGEYDVIDTNESDRYRPTPHRSDPGKKKNTSRKKKKLTQERTPVSTRKPKKAGIGNIAGADSGSVRKQEIELKSSVPRGTGNSTASPRIQNKIKHSINKPMTPTQANRATQQQPQIANQIDDDLCDYEEFEGNVDDRRACDAANHPVRTGPPKPLDLAAMLKDAMKQNPKLKQPNEQNQRTPNKYTKQCTAESSHLDDDELCSYEDVSDPVVSRPNVKSPGKRNGESPKPKFPAKPIRSSEAVGQTRVKPNLLSHHLGHQSTPVSSSFNGKNRRAVIEKSPRARAKREPKPTQPSQLSLSMAEESYAHCVSDSNGREARDDHVPTAYDPLLY